MKKILLQNRQFLLYCIIGASGTLLDFGVFAFLVKAGFFGYQGANAVSYASGTLLSFILNARINFRVSDRIPLRLACFFGVAFLGWLISAGLLNLLIGDYGMNQFASKFASLVVVVLVQYNLNRWLSFRKAN